MAILSSRPLEENNAGIECRLKASGIMADRQQSMLPLFGAQAEPAIFYSRVLTNKMSNVFLSFIKKYICRKMTRVTFSLSQGTALYCLTLEQSNEITYI